MSAKILIIDDERGIRDLFKYLLEPRGFAVSCAVDGLEGVEMARQEAFDIIFLDVHMPRMGGPEALKIIKRLRPEQVVIVFSSSSDPNFLFENEAKRLGAFDCIYKPFDIDDILNIMKKALDGTR